jgi:membrane-bound lytic murein transglycosylase B
VLVTSNFKALLQWNRSRYFAAAVSKLADAIEEQ